MKKYLTKQEVAKRWKCHKTTIDFRIRRGDLKYIEVNGKRKIHIDDVTLVESVCPVVPKRYAPKVRKAKVQHTKVAETQTVWSKIKKYVHDLFIR